MPHDATNALDSKEVCKTLIKHGLLQSNKAKEILSKKDTVRKKLERETGNWRQFRDGVQFRLPTIGPCPGFAPPHIRGLKAMIKAAGLLPAPGHDAAGGG